MVANAKNIRPQTHNGNRQTKKPRPQKKRSSVRVWLHVFPKDIWVPAKYGESILTALQRANVEVDSDCGGMGSCGKCKIKVLSVVDPPTRAGQKLLDKNALQEGFRLACRTKVKRDLAISTGESGKDLDYLKILTTSHVLHNRYIPTSQLEPLIERRPVTLPSESQNGKISDLNWVRLGLGPEYSNLKASIHCLRTLPQMLKGNKPHGIAVLHDDTLIAWQDPEKSEHGYGLVFDLGTSTIVGKLINLSNGSEAAVDSCLNRQRWHGSDVISRLNYVKQNPRGLDFLHDLLVNDITNITKHLLKTAGLKKEDILIAVAAGNTTMQHFLLNLTPNGIAEAPFIPAVTDGLIVNATDVGLELNPSALLYTMPTKSGYIGGDLISFVLNSGVVEQEDEIILGLDLGTNGEIFLGNGKRLLTCSAAAGPALEGARISSGMIAKAGALEGVRIEEGQLHYRVIGNIKPKGICGSGLVDLVAVLLHCGVIDPEGLIRPTQKAEYQDLNSRVIKRSYCYDFLVASEKESFYGRPIYLTQKDIRELQLAKAAVAAGVHTLIDELGIGIDDIRHVYLAGALGNYIDPISTLRIGLLPRINVKLIRSLGNAASLGASMVLLSKKYWQMAKDVVSFMEHIELSYRHDFNQYFVQHMDFPKRNIW
jgi:uncharacterized 2Fe-2S/4Fe-4S cluster protein (DUF4445 family)